MLSIEVIGNIGQDAQIRENNGRRFVSFSVADSTRVKDNYGQPVDKTTWVSCFLNGDGGKLTAYLKKGTPVFVRGRIAIDTYRRQDNTIAASLTCNVEEIHLLPSKREGNGQATNQDEDRPF